jgi:hypothetical protein
MVPNDSFSSVALKYDRKPRESRLNLSLVLVSVDLNVQSTKRASRSSEAGKLISE